MVFSIKLSLTLIFKLRDVSGRYNGWVTKSQVIPPPPFIAIVK